MPTRAGPKLRAGLTEAPLIGIAATWIATSARGIATRALPRTRSLFDDWRITATKSAEKTNSTTTPAQTSGDCVVVPATAASLKAIRTTSDAAIAPMNCATT